MTHWTDGRLVGFDLETTHPDPEEARIVTASIVTVGGGIEPHTQSWLVDPGVEIPEQASEIHGVTTEHVREHGEEAAQAVCNILCALGQCDGPQGLPLVIFNARYDLTVLDREVRRHGVAVGFAVADMRFRVIDPFVLDKWLDRYRRGSRKLDAMCAHYGAIARDEDATHDAADDALAAARLAWCIGKRGQVIRRVRSAHEGYERQKLIRKWETHRDDLDRLHRLQEEEALIERRRFADYKRSIGEIDEADRIDAEIGWPVLELRGEVRA